MSKPSLLLFTCSKCNAQFPKWSGRCSECQSWGTLVEDIAAVETVANRPLPNGATPTSFLTLLTTEPRDRLLTKLDYWDRTLSGGLVAGSVTLVGGEPGIGKSTLLAQLGINLANEGKTVLYVTGEESPHQVSLRLQRFATSLSSTLTFLDQTQADIIAATIIEQKPALTIIDSIQTLRLPQVAGEPGNPTQMKACAATVSAAAKQAGVAVIFVGQVTKDGELAGPRLLEHLVDTVAMLEGDRQHSFRLLRLLKHRFGNTDESAVLSMTERGLEEVLDPSAALVADRPKQVSGSLVSCLMQGSRALLVELQALVAPAGYGTPTRRASGIDVNRLSLLLAVLGRRAGVNLSDQDVFVNAVGGMDAKEPSIDLALALAIASAKFDKPLSPTVAAWGEVGLSGEIRPVSQSDNRIKEAGRLGFTTLIVPPKTQLSTKQQAMKLMRCETLREAIEKI